MCQNILPLSCCLLNVLFSHTTLGVGNLTQQLTKLLVRRIQQELVPMKHEVEVALQTVMGVL